MTENPRDPASPAMILYYAVETDNNKQTERRSTRIKIFKESARKYADVEIPFIEKYMQVEDIQGKAVSPGGAVTPLPSQIFERDLVKARKFKYHAKVFTFPGVQPGSVVEYSYLIHYKDKIPDEFRHSNGYIFRRGLTYPAAEWEVQKDLYLKHAHFLLQPVKGAMVREYHVGLTPEINLHWQPDGRVEYDAEDLPPLPDEEYALPEKNRRGQIFLFYAAGFYNPDQYWDGLGAVWADDYNKFIGTKPSKVIQAEVARIVAPNDDPETAARKIYVRVQQIHQVSSEETESEEKIKREKLKENKNAEEVLQHGYAYGNEINLLFVAMARSKGFEAYPAAVASREHALFMRDYPNHEQLNGMVVFLKLPARNYMLDPATRFCPFGLLPWYESDAGGITLSANPRIGLTQKGEGKDATRKTEGNLKLSVDGTLRGDLKVTYGGQEALVRRTWAIGEDDVKRKEYLEEEISAYLAESATVKLLNVDDWEKSADEMKAEFEIEIPNYANALGQRMVVPLGVLHTKDKYPFASQFRTTPIYFSYPFEIKEDLLIELPEGMQAEGLPKDKKQNLGAVDYQISVKKESNGIRITRYRYVGEILLEATEYPKLRNYYSDVAAGDSQQVLVRKVAAVSAPKP